MSVSMRGTASAGLVECVPVSGRRFGGGDVGGELCEVRGKCVDDGEVGAPQIRRLVLGSARLRTAGDAALYSFRVGDEDDCALRRRGVGARAETHPTVCWQRVGRGTFVCVVSAGRRRAASTCPASPRAARPSSSVSIASGRVSQTARPPSVRMAELTLGGSWRPGLGNLFGRRNDDVWHLGQIQRR